MTQVTLSIQSFLPLAHVSSVISFRSLKGQAAALSPLGAPGRMTTSVSCLAYHRMRRTPSLPSTDRIHLKTTSCRHRRSPPSKKYYVLLNRSHANSPTSPSPPTIPLVPLKASTNHHVHPSITNAPDCQLLLSAESTATAGSIPH
jgi:hypothetical protein